MVCGAKAFGYNFDQITCESCKGKYDIDQYRFHFSFASAFFRRNALKNLVNTIFCLLNSTISQFRRTSNVDSMEIVS